MEKHKHGNVSILTLAGHQVVAFLDYMGDLSLFAIEAGRSLAVPPWFVRETIAQMYQLGVKSLALVLVAAFALGMVLAMQGLKVLTWFGAGNYIATLVAMSMVRELGPIIAGIMLAARGGAGIGAELGSMRVTSQIDALTVSAVNPMKYLVVTRILACILILPLLTVFANLIGILGGMVIGMTQAGMSATSYYYLTLKFLTLKDVLPGIAKTMVFGLIISTVSCYHGFNTEQGTFGVGQATKTAVVVSVLFILVADVFLTKLTLLLWG
jgi:phospholipid/cholesterol/gamma-HCH transport system permease protein|uniref:ABC transporter permease n=1 Tax=Desulfobacca acetoxidans TaxID=60893 RepID=A0A7V6A2L9_9BACT